MRHDNRDFGRPAVMSHQEASAHASFRAMGTRAEVLVVGTTPKHSQELLQWAQRRVAELESRWSRFDAESDISRCNYERGSRVPVHPDTLVLVGTAIAAWEHSKGAFDPTIYDSLEALGYDRSSEYLTYYTRAYQVPRVPSPGCDGIEIDVAHRTVRLPHGVGFDGGGIGKGLGGDLITAGLMERGATGAMVNLGGDVRVLGSAPDGGRWVLGIEDPVLGADADLLATVAIDEGAVAASSTLVRLWNNGATHHLIDPRTGESMRTDVVAAIVVASQGWWAEALTKVVMKGGAVAGLAQLAEIGNGASGLVIDTNGVQHRAESLASFLVSESPHPTTTHSEAVVSDSTYGALV